MGSKCKDMAHRGILVMRLGIIGCFFVLCYQYKDHILSLSKVGIQGTADPWYQEQENRKLSVRKMCEKHASELFYKDDENLLFDSSYNWNSISFIPQYNFLYCGVPKAGTSTMVKGTLMKLTNQTHRGNFLEKYKIADAATLRHILEGDPVSFVNVRHPYERLVSAFLMQKQNGVLTAAKTFEQFIIEDVLKKVNYNNTNRQERFREMNRHWRPSNTHCAYCNIRYTVISKMETFDEDKERMLELVGLKASNRGERLNIHGGDGTQNKTREWFNTISKENKTALADIFKYDFQMFHYNHDLE